MANQDFAHIARTTIRTIGAIQTDFKLEVPFTGTIPEVTVTVGGFSSFTGPWNLDFKLNGTLVGIDISIDGTDTTLIATGLSEAVTERDLIEPFITSLGGGGGAITGPIIITYTFRPAEKTTPVDADTVGITDSAASSAPKRVTWANIKATLLAYFDTLYVALTGAQTIAGVKTFSSDPIIPDEVYGAGWNGSLEPPTKNAVYDKVESLSGVTDGDKGDITVSGGGATWTADADAVVKMAGAQTVAGVKTFSSDPLIPDEAYDATNWNGVLEPPTKNAVRDKIEDILDGVTFTGDVIVPDEAYDATNWDGSLEVPTKNALRDKIETIVAGAGDVATDTIFDLKGDIPVGTGADAANNLPVGTDGQVLTADSGETMGVKWAAAAGSGITRSVVESSASFTAGSTAATDYVYRLAGAHVPTLPTAVGNTNKYTFINEHTAPIAFTTTSSQTVDGHASTVFRIYPKETVVMYSDGSNWITSVKGQWRQITKLATESRSSTTTVAVDSVLFFPMLNGRFYQFDMWLTFYADSVTPDFKYSLVGPTHSAGSRQIIRDTSATGITVTPTRDAVAATALPTNVAILNNNALGTLRFQGSYIPTATGLFEFHWAQNTSDAALTYVLEGAVCKFIEN